MSIQHYVLPVVGFALLASPLSGQEASTPDLTEIEESLVEIRGLPFKEPVIAEQQSMEDFQAFLTAEIDKWFSQTDQEGMQQGLLRLGLLTEPVDLSESLANAMLTQAAAYYDPGTGKFYYLMADMPPLMLKTVAAHELVHALQDQHFQLGETMEGLEAEAMGDGPRNDDRVLAFRYLVEGEATYVMTIWQMKAMMGRDITADEAMEEQMMKAMADIDIDQLIAMQKLQMPGGDNAMTEAIKAMEDIPSYILVPLLAAYMDGAYFTMRVRQAEGWDGLAAAYESLPQSTEQTMHPEKFIDQRDEPSSMSTAPLSAAKAAALEQIDAAILGEFYLGLLLSNLGIDDAAAKAAAAGWDGDLYRAYRTKDGQVAIVLASTWDTEEEAAEFLKVYCTALQTKYPDMVLQKQGAMSFQFQCGEPALGVGRVVQRGREVFIVEGAQAELADSLLEQLKAQPVQHVK
jgi:hypothetical protein